MQTTRKRPHRLIAGLALLLVALGAHAEDAPPDPSGLRLASVHAAVADLDADRLLYTQFSDKSVPIASLTKLMTGLVVLESGAPLGEWLAIPERDKAAANNAYTRMRVGSELPRRDLLRLALMASENHAAYTLARHHPGGFDAFVEAMNEQARALGMGDTHFAGPSGLDPANRSTAADILRLVKAAHERELLRQYTQTARYTARFRKPRYNLFFGNTNVLVYRNHWEVELSKTGYLHEAGRCLALVTQMDGRTVAAVLLNAFGSRSPVGDVGRIKRWLRNGSGGGVARAAWRYKQRESRRFETAEAATSE